MNVSLTPELEQMVNSKVQSGLYSSASEVIREGLRLIKELDEIKEHRRSQLLKEIDIGIEQLENGQHTEYDVNNLQPLFDEIKAAGQKRLAQRKKDATK